MKKALFVVLGFALLLVGCERNYDYTDFADLHISETGQQLSMPEDEYYIYYYGSSCTHCKTIKYEALNIIANLKTDIVYFVVADSLQDIPEGVNVTQTPSLVKVSNGVAVELYTTADEVLNHLKTLE